MSYFTNKRKLENSNNVYKKHPKTYFIFDTRKVQSTNTSA